MAEPIPYLQLSEGTSRTFVEVTVGWSAVAAVRASKGGASYRARHVEKLVGG
jgi:hypothetical protein